MLVIFSFGVEIFTRTFGLDEYIVNWFWTSVSQKKKCTWVQCTGHIFLTISQWLEWLWGIEIASVGIAILDKQITILVKTSMEKGVMVPVCVSAPMIQSLSCCNLDLCQVAPFFFCQYNFESERSFLSSLDHPAHPVAHPLPLILSSCCHCALTWLVLSRPISLWVTCSTPRSTVMTALAAHHVPLQSCCC